MPLRVAIGRICSLSRMWSAALHGENQTKPVVKEQLSCSLFVFNDLTTISKKTLSRRQLPNCMSLPEPCCIVTPTVYYRPSVICISHGRLKTAIPYRTADSILAGTPAGSQDCCLHIDPAVLTKLKLISMWARPECLSIHLT